MKTKKKKTSLNVALEKAFLVSMAELGLFITLIVALAQAL